jgi:hypothetical protein
MAFFLPLYLHFFVQNSKFWWETDKLKKLFLMKSLNEKGVKKGGEQTNPEKKSII